MTIPNLINHITQEGYQNHLIFLRLTGRADNYILCIGFPSDNNFKYDFIPFTSRLDALREVKRLISIYIVTEPRGRVVIGPKHRLYIRKQII